MLLLLPYTLLTASALAVVAFTIGLRLGRVRYITNTMLGDGGIPQLAARVEGQAAFTAYVPLLLIIMALLEMGGAKAEFLMVFGALLVVFRLLHIAGMGRQTRSLQRVIGEMGSSLLLLASAAYGFYLSITAIG